MSQRALKQKIRDAEAELRCLARLDACAIAIAADAAGDDWTALRQRLDEYCRFLDARNERIHISIRDLEQQLRQPIRRRAP